MHQSFVSKINLKIENILNYQGCARNVLNSRKTLWVSTFFGTIHVFILTFSFLLFVPELTILIKYGFVCLSILLSTLLIIPFLKRYFNHYLTIHLILLMLVTFYTIFIIGGIVTSVGLIVACFSFVLFSIPLQSVYITIFLFLIYSVFVFIIGFIGPHLEVPDQITPFRNSIIWMINTLSMSALSVVFVVDFIIQQKKIEQLEATKQRELNEAKTKLFTNITHEFRTPLTIILGMTDLIAKSPGQWTEDGTKKIKNNTEILLRLVNQMLDISKIEAGAMHVHLRRGDIISFIGYLTDLFRTVAHDKNISLQFSSDKNSVEMDFDEDKLAHIVSNLLANSLKFTSDSGSIIVKSSLNEKEDKLTIQVADTGKGIGPEYLPFIFDRFYQGDNNSGTSLGSGLGLALAKEFTELMKGTIEVVSQPLKGTTFTVSLPVTYTAPLEQSVPWKFSDYMSWPSKTKRQKNIGNSESFWRNNLPTLLIVEDSPDLLQYLSAILQDEYRIELAENGKSGLEKSLSQIPDIVLSDVMMPEMDGVEMLEKIKHDFRTSHIPVVLLTAKADIDSRLLGLERGADAYISKPFNENELHVQLKNLIVQRERLHKRYTSFSNYPETNEKAIKIEDAFMIRVRNILEKNMENEDYGINDLCRELAVSHAQLYRKFKSISNQTISGYFKLLRLHKAKELLQKHDLNITQIAFAVGFKNLSHFSREFAHEFGQSPKKIQNSDHGIP